MISKNAKVAVTTTAIIVVLLLFSWQYIGDGSESESFDGEWKVVATTVMVEGQTVSEEPLPPIDADKVTVSLEGEDLWIRGGTYGERFVTVSDCEAVSVGSGLNTFVYLHKGVLFHVDYVFAETESGDAVAMTTTVLTRDGSYTYGDSPDMVPSSYSTTVNKFTDFKVAGQSAVSVSIDGQNDRSLVMKVDVDGKVTPALGFLKDDCGDRRVVTGYCPNGDIVNILIEGDSVSMTGYTTIKDIKHSFAGSTGDGLSVDAMGIYGEHTLVNITDGSTIDVLFFYNSGVMLADTGLLLRILAAYMPTLLGDGLYTTGDDSIIVEYGEGLGYAGTMP